MTTETAEARAVDLVTAVENAWRRAYGTDHHDLQHIAALRLALTDLEYAFTRLATHRCLPGPPRVARIIGLDLSDVLSCDRCGATPGKPCVTAGGNRAAPHASRLAHGEHGPYGYRPTP